MEERLSQLLEGIRQIRRCRKAVRELADRMACLALEEYETLIQELVINGEDLPLGILLNVCAVNKVKLGAAVLAKTIAVAEPLTDFALPYCVQDGSAIGTLLQAAQREDISWERQVLAARISAELAVRFETDRPAVRRTLLKLKTKIYSPELRWRIERCLALVDGEEEMPLPELALLDRDALRELPEEREPLVIGGAFTVRRPVAKLSRNAPCHCGSGKKYKKCCYEKDQDLLRDASPYQGVTMTQVRSAPDMVDDTSLINGMRAYELKKLDATRLNPPQLLAAYRRADLFGLRELAFSLLQELERRPGEDRFDPGHFEDLLYSALDAGNVELAERILAHVPSEELWDPGIITTNLHVLKHREHFEPLEKQCQRSLAGPEEDLPDDPMLQMAYGLERTFPALSIVFARAFILGNPDRLHDSYTLLDIVRSARTDIGLDPMADPVEDFLEQRADEGEEDEWRREEIERLVEDAASARREMENKGKELQEKERQLKELVSKMEEERREPSPGQPVRAARVIQEAPRDRDTILRLRQRIESLKEEIRSQQEHRRQLRRQLHAERAKGPAPQRPEDIREGSADADGLPPPGKEIKRVLVPEYAPAFRHASEAMDPPVVAKALRAVAAFAAHDPLVWRQTKPVKRVSGLYRIRAEKDYRVMLRWEPDNKLEVLDLIPRSQLETWIRQHAR